MDPASSEPQFSSKNPEPGWATRKDAAATFADDPEYREQLDRRILYWYNDGKIQSKRYEDRPNALVFVKLSEVEERENEYLEKHPRPVPAPPEPEPTPSVLPDLPRIFEHIEKLQAQNFAAGQRIGRAERERDFFADQVRLLKGHLPEREARKLLREHPEIGPLPIAPAADDDANVPSRHWYWGWWRTPPATTPDPLPAQQEGEPSSENGVEVPDPSDRPAGDSDT